MKKGNALHYGIFKSPMKDENGKNIYYVRARSLQKTVSFETICENIQDNASAKVSDVIGITAALSEEIATQLSGNNRVHIEGLGYFSLKMRLNKKKNVTDSRDIRASDITISGVNFQPEKKFITKCTGGKNKFEIVSKADFHTPDESTIRTSLSEYFKTHTFITIREFAVLINVSYKVSRERLISMSSGEFPRLIAHRLGRQILFCPV
jgi:predicted histone-like DNA-binding protein